MPRTIRADGRVITVPDDATPDEINQIVGPAPKSKEDPLFDPATKGPMSTGIGTAGPAPTGIMPWLEDLQRDVKKGTDRTLPGKVMKFLGAKGTDYGAPEAVGDVVIPGGSTIQGAAKAAHGVGRVLQGHPVKGANEVARGFGQAAAPLIAATNPEFLPAAVAYGTAGAGVEKGAKSLGASEDTSELLGNLVTGILGGRKAIEKSESGKTNKLAFASGKDSTGSIDSVKGELAKTIKQTGPPQTVGDFLKVVKTSKDGLNSEYANALGPNANKQTMPKAVADRIRALITPNMQQTAPGRAEAAVIKRAATDFEKPWTLAQLDSERMSANARLNAYEKKNMADQYAAIKGSRNTAIDKAIADGVRDTVYPIMDHSAGKPSGYFASLKGRIGDMMELESNLSKRVADLHDTTARIKGAPRLQRARIGTTVGTSGTPRSWVSNIAGVLHAPNPEGEADSAVRSAYNPASIEPGIAALPIKVLLTGDATEEKKGVARALQPAGSQ